MHAAQEPPLDPFDGPVPVGGGMMAPGRSRPGRASGHARRRRRRWPTGPAGSARPQDGPPRSSLPMPSGAPVPGLGDPLADREVKREPSASSRPHRPHRPR